MANVGASRTISDVAIDIHAIACLLEAAFVGHCSGRSSKSGRR